MPCLTLLQVRSCDLVMTAESGTPLISARAGHTVVPETVGAAETVGDLTVVNAISVDATRGQQRPWLRAFLLGAAAL